MQNNKIFIDTFFALFEAYANRDLDLLDKLLKALNPTEDEYLKLLHYLHFGASKHCKSTEFQHHQIDERFVSFQEEFENFGEISKDNPEGAKCEK